MAATGDELFTRAQGTGSDAITGVRSVRDPRGREVRLGAERWRHIISGHPELREMQADIVRAVESPSEVLAGRAPDEEWFYLAGAGPSRWLKVVVVFDRAASGRIITAFGRRRKP
jgi:hypothetical protein